MSLRDILTNDLSPEKMREAILSGGRVGVSAQRKLHCTVCGTNHAVGGANLLCPVCKRPYSGFLLWAE